MRGPLLIDPVWQRVWQWPAVVSLILGGAGAGFFLACIVAEYAGGTGPGGIQAVTRMKWVGSLLVLTGLAAVAIEAGRPRSARYLLNHLQTSWMSREVLTGTLFTVAAVLDMLMSRALMEVLAGVAAAGFLLSQGMMVNRARAVAAWNLEVLPVHFFSSALCLGFGTLLTAAAATGVAAGPPVLLFGLAALLLNALIWFSYVHFFIESSPGQATLVLRHTRSMLQTLGMGHLLPLLLIMVLLGTPSDAVQSPLARVLLGIAGVTVLFGGVCQKAAVILQANRLREVRGSRCTG